MSGATPVAISHAQSGTVTSKLGQPRSPTAFNHDLFVGTKAEIKGQ